MSTPACLYCQRPPGTIAPLITCPSCGITRCTGFGCTTTHDLDCAQATGARAEREAVLRFLGLSIGDNHALVAAIRRGEHRMKACEDCKGTGNRLEDPAGTCSRCGGKGRV